MTKVKNQKLTSVADQLNHNTAFMSRSKKEEERHQAQMSEKLRNDMLRCILGGEGNPASDHSEVTKDTPGSDYLDEPISADEIEIGIKKLKLNKSPGLHGVPIDDWFQSSPGELPVLQLSQKSPDESKTFLDTLYTSEHMDKGFIIRGLKLPDHVDISGLVVDCSDEVPNIADNQTQNGPEETKSADVSSSQTSQTIRSEDEQLASSTLPDAVVEEASADDEGSQDAEKENGSARELTASKDANPEDIDSDENTGANSHCRGKQGSAGYSAVLAENNAGDSKILESSTGDSSVTETASLPDSLTSENGAHSNQLNKDEGDDTEVTSDNSSKDSPVKECPATAENTTVGLAEEKCEGDSNKDISYRPCSNLSSDLLQFYQSGDKTDCCLKVEGQKLMAHRCILAARCEYFSAMFAGSWSETDEIEIELHDVKAPSMKYILLFLYGAMVDVPITDITAVIQASDMYGVQGFKDWLCFQIVRDFCHFFHKPCQDCTRMVPDVLVLATQFNLADLSERAKRWMATHFRRIWEMQTFGSLPPSLLEECTKAVIDQMSIQNVTQIILDAHDLARTLQQNHRSSEQVQIAAIQITDKALAFCAQHFPQLVKSPNFFSWSKSGAWCLDLLAESYTMAVSLLQPDAACEVYTSLRNQLAHCEKTTADGGGGIASGVIVVVCMHYHGWDSSGICLKSGFDYGLFFSLFFFFFGGPQTPQDA
ncbi:uncharacterized protein [Littorina saxatilis]|uniref:uncharacterized protein n=1 Tax=Littorina saxatilis TaxID=31220 RepID=UPI0038B44A10